MRLMSSLPLACSLLGLSCPGAGWAAPAEHKATALDLAALIPHTLPHSAAFRQPGWHLWDPCVINGDDGRFYLFYARWPEGAGFDAWCTHAEIAWATAPAAAGPYTFQGVALPARGGDHWDGHSVFNTCVIRADGKFYLYHTGNRGTADWKPDRAIPSSSDEWWVHRNNQRIGVAVADSLTGPWKRGDKPLIDAGPDFGRTIINVPNMVAKPEGGYRMYYKTLAEGEGRFGGGVFHYGADAPTPLGPFVRHPRPMVDKNELLPAAAKRFDFHIDDHFEWFQDGRYYAIVKDHDAPFLTPHGRSLLLFESADGRDWKPSAHALVKDFSIRWEDGTREDFARLEMPKLLIEDGRPTLLSLAAYPAGGGASFLVLIPLKPSAAAEPTAAAAAGDAPDMSNWLQPLRDTSVFSDPEYNIWCGSVVEGGDGRFHMFYSRWKRSDGHNAWVTHSEIARAVSDSPHGPFRHAAVILPARDRAFWDGACTHNPTIIKTGGKYYLYYMGNSGDRERTDGLNWQHRNNQRIGVAVADRPEGPWKRFDKPLIDVSPDPAAPDALAVNNPSVTLRPDGSVLMIYKAIGRKGALPFGGPVVHLTATAGDPLGPFEKQLQPILTLPGESFTAEDPFLWRQDGRHLAIVKDMGGHFTGAGTSLALFTSSDGLSGWQPAPNPLVSRIEVRRPDGSLWKLRKLERPQVLTVAGRPVALYCAAADTPDLSGSFNLAIPLEPSAGSRHP